MTSARSRYELWAIALGSMAVTLLICSPSTVHADSEQPPRIAIAADLQVFSLDEQEEPTVDELREAMRRGAIEQFRAETHPRIDVVDGAVLEEAITSNSLYDGTLELAREWGEMGVESYRKVESREAAQYLERSLQNFREIHHHIVAPAEISEMLMYLALSYLEDGTDVVRPLEVLREMIRRDPSRQLQPGYYPEFVVQYYHNARDSLWEQLRSEGPPPEESRRIGELVEADYVFHAYGIPDETEEYELTAFLFDVGADEFLDPERLVVERANTSHIEEGFGRLASRLAACLVDPADDDSGELTTSRGTSPLSVNLAMIYGSFLQVPSPIREPFGNYGIGFGADWSITREFRIIGSMYVSNSMRDYSGVLRDNFTTIRAMAGAELGGRFGPVSAGVGVGVEMARIGQIRAFTDRGCLPDPETLCPGDVGTATFAPQDLHWGVQIRPRLSWPLSDSFELSSSLAVGYYLSPLDGPLLNFPVVTQVGLHYRF